MQWMQADAAAAGGDRDDVVHRGAVHHAHGEEQHRPHQRPQLAPHHRARPQAGPALPVWLAVHVRGPLPPLAQRHCGAHLLWRPRVLQGMLGGISQQGPPWNMSKLD